MPSISINAVRAILVASITGLFLYAYLGYQSQSAPTELSPIRMTGVDRAHNREYLMTVDPSLGRVPTERLIQARQRAQMVGARAENSETFVADSWENLSTVIAGRTRTILADANTANKLWAGSVTGGLWSTQDYLSNTTWSIVPGMESFPPTCLVSDPNDPQVIYAGSGEAFTSVYIYRSSTTRGQGIAKSTDGGATWSLLEATAAFEYVTDMVVRDEEGQSVIYAGVASGAYQYRDFASENGLYRSADGGLTWSQVLPTLVEGEAPAVSDLALTGDGSLLVGTMRNLSGKGGGYLLSSSDGTTWEVHDEYQARVAELAALYQIDIYAGRTVLATAPSDPDRWYVLYMAAFENNFDQLREFDIALYGTPDAGTTWTELTQPDGWSNIPWHAAAMVVDPIDADKLAIGALNVYNADLSGLLGSATASPNWYMQSYWGRQFTSGGATTDFVHADIHTLQFVDNDPDRLLIGTDGGVFYSEDFTTAYDGSWSANFSYANEDLNTTQYYALALHPQSGVNEVIAGTQDNGTPHYKESVGQMRYADMISGGDGAFCFWDADNPELKISSFYANRYYVHLDGQAPELIGLTSGKFINPADYDDYNNLAYANMSDAGPYGFISSLNYRNLDSLLVLNLNPFLGTNNGADTVYSIRVRTGTGQPFSAVTVSDHPNHPDTATVYLGTQNGEVYKVTGLPYAPASTRIDNSDLPAAYISSIAEGAAGQLIVTFSNFGVESVWHTTNDGVEWTSLDGTTDGLPDMPIRWAEFDPQDHRRVFLATELGLYSRHLWEEDSWTHHLEDGLPMGRMDMLEIRPADRTMAIATHGYGLWLGQLQDEQVLSIPGQQNQRFTLYPNPATEYIKVKGPETPWQCRIVDTQGREVAILQPEADGSFRLPSLPTARYHVQGISKQGQVLFTEPLQMQP